MKNVIRYIVLFFQKIFRYKPVKIATCVYLIRDVYTLMGNQQNNVFGFKGYGGKLKRGQTILENVVEELWEETGGVPGLRINKEEEGGVVIRTDWLERVAIIKFYNNHDLNKPLRKPSFVVHFFICRKFYGKPIDTLEMKDHQFFNINHLPIEKMVKGDEVFIPPILKGRFLTGDIVRDKDWNIIKSSLKECTKESLNF